MRRRGRRRKQELDYVKEPRRYYKLKAEEQVRAPYSFRCGSSLWTCRKADNFVMNQNEGKLRDI